MKTYLISYSNGYIFAVTTTLRAAKMEATKRTTYQQQKEGIRITIYEENLQNAICYKSFNVFSEKSKNIGKWITI